MMRLAGNLGSMRWQVWRRRMSVRTLLAAWLAAVSLHATGAGPQPLYRHEASRMSMACLYSIEAYGPDAEALPHIVEEAFDEVDRIDRLMSHYKTDSELSRVNREAARYPVTVEPELFDFIADAMSPARVKTRISQWSGR
jgi:thiamine biosynthesis lipoprotein